MKAKRNNFRDIRKHITPKRLVISGTIFTVIAIIITGIVIPSMESYRRDLQTSIQNHHNSYDLLFSNYFQSQLNSDQAEMEMMILESGKLSAKPSEEHIRVITTHVEKAFFYLSLACGITDTQRGEYYDRFQRIMDEASNDDVPQSDATGKLFSEMRNAFFSKVQSLSETRDNEMSRESDLSKLISKLSALAIILQITGIFQILGKDILTTPSPNVKAKKTNPSTSQSIQQATP